MAQENNLFVATGTVAFENLRKRDMYNGKETKYNITLTLDQDSAEELKSRGVKLREYEGNEQRKFATDYQVGVLDANGMPYDGMVPRGSKVKVLYTLGKNPTPMHGVIPYLSKVKVVELAEPGQSEVEGF